MDETRLADAIADWLEQRRHGAAPPVEAFAARHGGIAEVLKSCLEAFAQADTRLGRSGLALDADFGDYRLIRMVGRGGMGVVYEAEERGLKRRVALKILPASGGRTAEMHARFVREAEITARLNHPHIVPVFQAGEVGGVPYYTMPLLRGESLDVHLKRIREGKAPAPVADGRSLSAWVGRFVDVARAMAAAHGAGILHRDLKPSNLFLEEDGKGGRLLVLDFGLARSLEDPAESLTGAPVGTPRYMSPEQVLGDRAAVDARSDVFSLGATLYEVLAREPAFAGRDREAVFRAILSAEPRAPRAVEPRVPRDLESIVQKALEKPADRRYAAAGELADDLQRFLDFQPVAARPIGIAGRWSRGARRHPVAAVTLLFAAVLLLVVALAPFWIALRDRQSREREIDADVNAKLVQARTAYARSRELEVEIARWNDAVARAEASLAPDDEPELKARAREPRAARDAMRVERERAVGTALAALVHALERSPGDARVRAELLGIARAELDWARTVGDPERTERFRQLLRDQGAAVETPPMTGSISLRSTPPAAAVHLFRFETREQRRLPVPFSPSDGALEGYLERARTRGPWLYFRVDAAEGDAELLRPGDLVTRVCDVTPLDELELVKHLLGGAHDHHVRRWREGRLDVVAIPEGALADIDGATVVEEAVEHSCSDWNRAGTTPLDAITLPAGSYLALLRASGYPDVRVPFVVRPDRPVALDIPLLTAEEIGEGFVYVPPGPALIGGDLAAIDSAPADEPIVEGFCIQRDEVTFRQYADFLRDLSLTDMQRARNACPYRPGDKRRFLVIGGPGEVIVEASFRLAGPDLLDAAVVGVRYGAARDYVRWLNDLHSAQPQRFALPSEIEWEKAARGADGRPYPWGDDFDWSFTSGALSLPVEPTTSWPPGRFPIDTSVFGVRDLAGNVREICDSPFETTPNLWVRGACWSARNAAEFRAASRFEHPERMGTSIETGFRVVKRRRT